MRRKMRIESHSSRFISPRELSSRWQCSRSSVTRISQREQLTRVYIGPKSVRFIRAEIEALEQAWTVKSDDLSLTAGRAGGLQVPCRARPAIFRRNAV